MKMKYFGTFVLCFVSLLLAGCAVGPHYKAPAPPTVQFHSADPSLVSQAPLTGLWWKQFEDPVLDSLMDRTLAANNNILIARARLAESRAVFDERKLDRYPVAPADGSYTYSKEQIPGFGDARRTINTFRAGFDAFWELDVFGRVNHEVAAARAGTEAFAADLRDVQISVVAELARNYFELRGAQWRLAVAEQSLLNQRETLRLTQLRRDAGVGEEQDVASAAARVAATEATIPGFQYEVSRAGYRVAVLTGVQPGELKADLSPRNYPPIARALPIGDPGELLQRRPDVRAAERRLASATEQQGETVAEMFPKVSVSGFLGFLAGRGNLFATASSAAWSVGPTISWSAFDLGRARARVRGSKAATDEAVAIYQDTILRALEETENSLANYHTQQARLVKLNDQARESKRAADIARLRYREGVIDFLSLLDAERTQLQAEDGVAEAESDVYVAVISVYKALGGPIDQQAQP
ncbi:MAG TPA: efflux transporter outer membrane subunit [Candidatus Angelobacter sp.]|nr:efflux transporter outer membrane subunit [Candidatus Angelobacter sp.]